jgi:hypothetical protein
VDLKGVAIALCERGCLALSVDCARCVSRVPVERGKKHWNGALWIESSRLAAAGDSLEHI